MKNKNILEIMLSIIKNEQNIINTEQAVKVISCLLIKKIFITFSGRNDKYPTL